MSNTKYDIKFLTRITQYDTVCLVMKFTGLRIFTYERFFKHYNIPYNTFKKIMRRMKREGFIRTLNTRPQTYIYRGNPRILLVFGNEINDLEAWYFVQTKHKIKNYYLFSK